MFTTWFPTNYSVKFVTSPVLALLHLYISVVSKCKSIMRFDPRQGSVVFLPEAGGTVSQKVPCLHIIIIRILWLKIHGQACKYKSYGSFSSYLYIV